MHTPHNGIEAALRAVSGGGVGRSAEMAVLGPRTSAAGALSETSAVTVTVAAPGSSATAHLPDNSVRVVTASAAATQSARI